MRIEATSESLLRQEVDAVVVGFFEGERVRRGESAEIDRALKGLLRRALERGQFKGKYCQTLHLPALPGVRFGGVLLLGLGRRDEFDVRRLKGAVLAAGRSLARQRCRSAAFPLLGRRARRLNLRTTVEVIAEGLERSTFEISTHKSDPEERVKPLERVVLAGLAPSEASAAGRAIVVGQTIGSGANLARELANLPGNLLGPDDFAQRAKALAREVGLEVDVLDEKRMRRLKMGAILAVGQGSSRPPRMVVLRYDGGSAGKVGGRRCYGFVGKGITFDSGGISIKPSSGMWEMKYDMSGAAAVLGAMRTIALLQPRGQVLGVMACAENLPSGTATRPGDIVTARNGRTIEIISTDAEGRLVLADALTYAVERGATHLLDLATLTGACIVALGHEASGLMTNNPRWADSVKRAADRAGERLWELPLFPEYRDDIKSKVADIKNVGAGRSAGTIAGGMFLKEFVGQTPWVHLDIAGTAWPEKARPDRPEGPTGVGVALMVRLLL